MEIRRVTNDDTVALQLDLILIHYPGKFLGAGNQPKDRFLMHYTHKLCNRGFMDKPKQLTSLNLNVAWNLST